MLGRCWSFWSVTCRGRGNIWWTWSVTFHGRCMPPNHTPKSPPRAGARNFHTYTYFSWYTHVIMFVYRKFFELDFFWQLEYTGNGRWSRDQGIYGKRRRSGAKFDTWGPLCLLVKSNVSSEAKSAIFFSSKKEWRIVELSEADVQILDLEQQCLGKEGK